MAQGGRGRGDAEVQDSSREAGMATLLGLSRSTRRIGDDAIDEFGHSFELKSTTSNSVGTSRDVGHTYLDRMLARTLVVLKGRSTVLGYDRDAIALVTPREILPWVEDLRAKIRADEDLVERAIFAGGEALSIDERERLKYLGTRGATRNNPKIPWGFVLEAGVMLRSGREAEDLASVLAGFDHGEPLASLRERVEDPRPVRDPRAELEATDAS